MTSDLALALPQLVPFVGTLGIRYEIVSVKTARLALEDDPSLHNHLGMPHAAVLFALAESASGAIVVSAVGHLLDRVTPVLARSGISFHRPAKGAIRAEAAPDSDVRLAIAEAEAGRKGNLTVTASIFDGHGVHAATATFDWVLVPPRSADQQERNGDA